MTTKGVQMDSQTRRLYIHIGTRKTGSTSLQQFLTLNRDRLLQDGYIYRLPKLPDYASSTSIGNGQGEEVFIYDYRSYPKQKNGTFLCGSPGDSDELNLKRLKMGLSILSEWFKEKPNVILKEELISSACFGWDFLSILKDFIRSNNIEVKIIVFLRRQDDFLESLYHQLVKHRLCSDDWNSFLVKNNHSDTPPTNYERMLSMFSDPFGKENIVVIPFEPAVWSKQGQTIYSLFLDALSIKDQHSYEFPNRPENESLSCNQTEILRIMNRLAEMDPPLTLRTKSMFINASRFCTGLIGSDKKLSYLSDEERTQLMAEYEDENHRIAEKYLGRDKLFISENRSVTKWENDPSAMQEEMVLFMGFVLKQLNEELLYLKEHSLSLYAVKLKLYRLKKKLLSFFKK